MGSTQSVKDGERPKSLKKVSEVKLRTKKLLKGASPDMEWESLIDLAEELIEETKLEMTKRERVRKQIVQSYRRTLHSYGIGPDSSLISLQPDDKNGCDKQARPSISDSCG